MQVAVCHAHVSSAPLRVCLMPPMLLSCGSVEASKFAFCGVAWAFLDVFYVSEWLPLVTSSRVEW